MAQMKQRNYDALVVGCGFGGIYSLKKLRDLGLSVIAIDAAGDVGGTWYWNRYPGAMSDTNAHIYRYSWDQEDLKEYHWKDTYVKQPEVLAYLKHVTERHNLRKDMQFKTELRAADWDDSQGKWIIQTSTNEVFAATYVVTALGLLSKLNFPDIPGLMDFKGELYHTGNWPDHYDFTNKRVGILGCGSTGVQVITQLGKENKVKSLTSYQRTPQYCVPSGDRPMTKEEREDLNKRWPEVWNQVKTSFVSFGFEESQIPAMSVSPEERQRIFQENWDLGNGFRFMFGTFCDITFNEEANEAACDFIRSKVTEIVKDPEKRRKIMPYGYYARRPLCDGGYYEQFNKDNFDVVNLNDVSITGITDKGIMTSDGKLQELDVLIVATGFDAMDGNYTRVNFKGRSGKTLKEHWDTNPIPGPTAFMGMTVADFPNLFTITGPMGAFTNLPPLIDIQVDWIGNSIQHTGKNGVFEVTQQAEDDWTAMCNKLCAGSLFEKTHSWIFGTNIPGKRKSCIFFFGGMLAYRQKLAELVENGYSEYKIKSGEAFGGSVKPAEPLVKA